MCTLRKNRKPLRPRFFLPEPSMRLLSFAWRFIHRSQGEADTVPLSIKLKYSCAALWCYARAAAHRHAGERRTHSFHGNLLHPGRSPFFSNMEENAHTQSQNGGELWEKSKEFSQNSTRWPSFSICRIVYSVYWEHVICTCTVASGSIHSPLFITILRSDIVYGKEIYVCLIIFLTSSTFLYPGEWMGNCHWCELLRNSTTMTESNRMSRRNMN